MKTDRIPSSRTSKAAGIEIGVEALEELAREVRNGSATARPIGDPERQELVAHVFWKALQLQKKATRALRGMKW